MSKKIHNSNQMSQVISNLVLKALSLVLKSLDASASSECFYVRYIDGWIILTKTRSQLRRMVKKMHQVMQRLKFKLALDKTLKNMWLRFMSKVRWRFAFSNMFAGGCVGV